MNSIIFIAIKEKSDRRDPQNYRGFNILNNCYKRYSKVLNMELQSYSEDFMTETERIPKGTFVHRSNALP
jgi:hypothetical protein